MRDEIWRIKPSALLYILELLHTTEVVDMGIGERRCCHHHLGHCSKPLEQKSLYNPHHTDLQRFHF